METVEPFINSAFAVDATYTDAAGRKSQIRVIFTRENSIEPAGAGIAVQNPNPVARCKSTDVEDADNTCRLEINEVNYYVTAAHDDATGMTTLDLSKDAP